MDEFENFSIELDDLDFESEETKVQNQQTTQAADTQEHFEDDCPSCKL